MSTWGDQAIAGVIVTASAAGLSYLTGRAAARRGARADAARAAGEAYDRAQRFNESIVGDLEHHIERLERRAEAAEQRAEAAEQRADQLEVQVRGLQRTIQLLARQMLDRGMNPPPEAFEELQ